MMIIPLKNDDFCCRPAADSVIPYLFDPDQSSGLGCEDPTMFPGRNGSLHMLLHKYCELQ